MAAGNGEEPGPSKAELETDLLDRAFPYGGAPDFGSRRRRRRWGRVGAAFLLLAATHSLIDRDGDCNPDEPKPSDVTFGIHYGADAGEPSRLLGRAGVGAQTDAWNEVEGSIEVREESQRLGIPINAFEVVVDAACSQGSEREAEQTAARLTRLASQKFGLPTSDRPASAYSGEDGIVTIHVVTRIPRSEF